MKFSSFFDAAQLGDVAAFTDVAGKLLIYNAVTFFEESSSEPVLSEFDFAVIGVPES